MAKLAILVGCCYPKHKKALKGCYNDVETVQELLTTRFGFKPQNVVVLTDKPGSSLLPTGAQIKKALNRMIEQAKAGDVLLCYFSGHGIYKEFGEGSDCKREEAIVPSDFNLIYSVDFRDMVNRMPKGADFVLVSDSCNSGGLIDQLKEQVGPGLPPDVCYDVPKSYDTFLVPKLISITEIVQDLEPLTGLNTPDVGQHLLHVFGTDASLKFRAPADAKVMKSFKVDEGILVSGCQFNEYSYDDGRGPRPHGRFTAALFDSLKEQPGPISNKLLVEKCRAKLSTQHPCLFCSDENVSTPFLHSG